MATINIRVDDALKRDAEEVLAGIGLNMTTATTVFLKQVVRTQSIPFELKSDPFFSKANLAHIDAAFSRLDAGLGVEHELVEA